MSGMDKPDLEDIATDSPRASGPRALVIAETEPDQWAIEFQGGLDPMMVPILLRKLATVLERGLVG